MVVRETAVAFSPGHISGFFDPYYARDPKKSGSTGAGISISLGVTARVRVLPSVKQEVNVFINDKPSDASTTKLAVMQLIGDEPFKVDVKLSQILPVSQGFGMSGAGALSAALATAKLCGLGKMDAIEAAHKAEVIYRTGLGDVVAESFGGIEIRRSPGLPPWGMVEHIPGDYKIVLCVMVDKLSTSKVLSDAVVLKKSRDTARVCLDELLDNPSVEKLFKL
ncbi:MAG TPA: pantothenate kinase, partial [Thermoplasmatales archaeon]|nr:pantothenate kinase [Thermoplasmatales archaeon]